MSTRILVAYASQRGSTAGIAQAIGRELESAGYSVDTTPMKLVSSLDGYAAVVIGTPIYIGKVVGEARAFLKYNETALLKVPVAGFCVGIAPVSKNPAEKDSVLGIFHSAIASVNPVDETIFAGKVEVEKLPFVQKWMWKKVQGPVGDFRDWEAISAWARELPGKLGLKTIPPG